jgi:hypothetical protein
MVETREKPRRLADEADDVTPTAPFFTSPEQPDRGTPENDHPNLRNEIYSFQSDFLNLLNPSIL